MPSHDRYATLAEESQRKGKPIRVVERGQKQMMDAAALYTRAAEVAQLPSRKAEYLAKAAEAAGGVDDDDDDDGNDGDDIAQG